MRYKQLPLEILDEYTNGASLEFLGTKYSVNRHTIKSFLQRHNITISGNNRYSHTNSGRWCGYGEISGKIFTSIKHSAKKRNIEFNITIEYIWELFQKQNSKCALTHLPLAFGQYRKSETTASLDRIDSNQGYIVGNLQWVHKTVNIMKSDMSTEEFLTWCALITEVNNNERNRKKRTK